MSSVGNPRRNARKRNPPATCRRAFELLASSRDGWAGVRRAHMNRHRWAIGSALFFSLVAMVILLLAFAHAWAPPTIDGQGARCFVDLAHSKFPMWLGCVMAVNETLAGGLIAAAGALF